MKPCGNGLHDMDDPENQLWRSDGFRQCRACHVAAKRAYAERKRAEGGPVAPRRIEATTCAVEGCDRPRRRATDHSHSRLCSGHYDRMRHSGELYEELPLSVRGGPLAARRARLAAEG